MEEGKGEIDKEKEKEKEMMVVVVVVVVEEVEVAVVEVEVEVVEVGLTCGFISLSHIYGCVVVRTTCKGIPYLMAALLTIFFPTQSNK